MRVLAIGEGGDEAELAERKWMKGEGDASYIAIYPPKVAMISLTKNDFPVAVVIDSEAKEFNEKALLSVNDLGARGETWSVNSLSYANGHIYHRDLKAVVCIGE